MKSLPRFLLPNSLSYLRIGIGLTIPLLLLQPSEAPFRETWNFWVAALLFGIGAWTDFWDGWIARQHRLETPFGRILDPTADKIFVLATMTSFAVKGVYSYWFLLPIYIREMGVTFCRAIWLSQGEAIGAERAGKLKLGFQMASVFFSFLYLGWPSPGTRFLNFLFLIVALGLTLYSGFFFIRHHRALLQDSAFLKRVAGLGVGHLRPFPGTYGSLVGLFFVPWVAFDPLLHSFVLLSFVALAYGVIGQLGLREEEDPLDIVIDEACGILLAFWGVRIHAGSLFLGFLLFRFFDAVKVFPLRWLENRKGVHGIVLDDLGAGVYTWLILKIVFG